MMKIRTGGDWKPRKLRLRYSESNDPVEKNDFWWSDK